MPIVKPYLWADKRLEVIRSGARRIRLAALCALTIFGCLLPIRNSAAAEQSVAPKLEALRSADIRLGSVLFRLLRDNSALCQRHGALTGLILHSRKDYDADIREAATQVFSFESDVGIEGVVAGSPAEGADVARDDSLVAIDGHTLNGRPDPRAAALAAIDRAAADGTVTLTLRRGGTTHTVVLRPDTGCLAHAEVRVSDDRNAATDGDMIQVDSGLMNLVSGKSEFAALVAHELSHIVLDHPERLDAAGVHRGLLKIFGDSGRLFRRTEREADRLSVVLLFNAGYDPSAASRLWQDYGAALGSGGFATVHQSSGKRARVLAAQAVRLRTVHPDQPYVPTWIESRDEPLE